MVEEASAHSPLLFRIQIAPSGWPLHRLSGVLSNKVCFAHQMVETPQEYSCLCATRDKSSSLSRFLVHFSFCSGSLLLQFFRTRRLQAAGSLIPTIAIIFPPSFLKDNVYMVAVQPFHLTLKKMCLFLDFITSLVLQEIPSNLLPFTYRQHSPSL